MRVSSSLIECLFQSALCHVKVNSFVNYHLVISLPNDGVTKIALSFIHVSSSVLGRKTNKIILVEYSFESFYGLFKQLLEVWLQSGFKKEKKAEP